MTATDSYQLTDRFLEDEGTVFLTGIQALARQPLEQLRADHRRRPQRLDVLVIEVPTPFDVQHGDPRAPAAGQLLDRQAVDAERGCLAVTLLAGEVGGDRWDVPGRWSREFARIGELDHGQLVELRDQLPRIRESRGVDFVVEAEVGWRRAALRGVGQNSLP